MTLRVDHPTLIDVLVLAHGTPEEEREQFAALTGVEFNSEDAATQFYFSQGPKVALFDDIGNAVCIMGLRRIRRGVFDTWFICPDASWAKYGREITKRTKQLLTDTLESGLAHRVECYVLASRERAQRWYGTIGLDSWVPLRRYGVNGEDFLLYYVTRKPVEV